MSTIQYVTVAQALSSTSSGLNVRDTAANIAAALPNASLTSRVSSFSLSASATLAGAALAKLAALTDFSLNDFGLTVSDAAYVLLSLSKAEIKLISQATLTGSPTLNAAQLTQLEALPHFTVAGGDAVTVSDSLGNIAAAIGTHPAWFTPVSAVTVRLDGSHIGAFAAAQLGLLEAAGKTVTFNASGSNTTLVVAAAATSIAANAAGLADLNGHVTVTYNVTNPGVAVSAADGAALAGLAGFSVVALSVSDTGANIAAHAAALFGHGFTGITVSSGNFAGTSAQLLDPALHLGANATVSLSASATVSGSAANALAALPGFAVGAGATLTVQDSVVNLLALTPAAQAAAGVVELSASQTVSVAQLQALAALGSKFHEAGFTLSVQDTAAALEAVPNQALALAAHVTVADTAANILTATSHNWGSVTPSYALSANASVSGAQATALAGLGASFSLNSKTLSVQDNAAGVTSAALALASLGIQATVTDTVAGISSNEAALAQLGSALNAVTISDPSSASAQEAASLAPLAAKFSATSTLTVLDGAANVTTYLSPLETIAAKLGAHLTLDISGTPAQLAADVSAFAGTGTVLQLSVSGGGTVSAAEAAALAPYLANTTLNITDTGADVAQYAAQLAAAGSQIGTVTLSDAGGTYSAAVAAGIAGVDSHLANGVLLSVNDSAANIGLAAAGLTKLATDGRLAGISDNFDSAAGVAANVAALNAVQAHVTIQDTTADVQAHLDALGQVAGLSRVTLTDIGGQTPYLSFGVAQLTSDASLLTAVRAVTSNYTVNVSDSVATVAADLGSANSTIVADLAKIRSVTSPAGPISLTWAQEQTLVTSAGVHLQNVLALLTGGWTVTGVPLETTTGGNTVDNLATLAGYAHPPSEIVVADTAAHISANLANTYGSIITGYTNIDGITVTDGQPVTLSVSQLGSLALLFSQSTKLTVQDSAADIVSDIASPQSALIAEVIANPAAITAITLSPNAGLSLTLTPAEALQLANAHALTAFTGLLPAGTILNVGATVADLATVAALPAGQLGHLTITVTDTPANLAADLLSGNSLLQRYSEAISSVTLAADPNNTSLTAAGLAALYTYGYTQPGSPVTLTAADTLANVLAVAPAALEQAHTSLTISDSAANLNTALASLTTAAQLETLATAIAAATGSHLTITLSDTNPVVTVSAGVYHSNATLLDTISNQDPISGRGPVIVTDNAANLDAIETNLVNDNHVGKVVVIDTIANVLAGTNLADLQHLGARLWIQLTDAQLTTAQLTQNANLFQTAHLSTTGAGVFDTVANLVSLAGDGAAAVAFMNTYGATVTSSPANGISVTALQTLEGLTDLHTNGLTFSVADTYQNLTGVGAAAVLSSNLVSGVYLTASAANISAAQAVALYGIHNFHASTITGTAEPVSVSDTAANIDAVYSQLLALGTQVTAIALSGNATGTAATLADLQALGATGTVTVNDTPANVANALAAQPVTSSVTLAGWTLATTGPATIAQAVALGVAEHAGSLTLPNSVAVIVNLGADTTLTAAQATDLGYLGANLDLTLNGHHLTVTDTAANLAALAGAALTHVLPGASIIVNDSASISESTAASLVSWLSTAAISPAQLSFAHVESVVGSIANLQSFVAQLQSFTATNGTWPNNTSLPASFHLTASDSYANLVGLTAGNNAAFLATLQGTTYDFADNGALNAAQAQTLATIATQIHFSAGTTMVVQDSAANLLAAANQAGVALASTVELTGTPTLDASDAVAVLSLHNLTLTANQLTIHDTAQNLLNPALDALLTGPAFSGDITVARTDNVAVTVQQAQTLAAIGVTGSPAIADTAANLINPANSTVLASASTVALSDNETVTAATAAQVEAALNTYGTLSSNLTASTGVLTLAASATVDAPTLLAIANLGTHFSAGSNTLTLASGTSNLNLTIAQFNTLQNDNVALNGNTVSITGSVAALAAFVQTPNWTNLSPALQLHYQLIASDTVANLDTLEGGGAHSSLVTSLHAIGLSQSDTTTVADANALAALGAGPLPFNNNGYSLTVTGMAGVNDLSPAAKAAATVIQVSEGTAETLLNGGLTLGAWHTLLVVDSAANLVNVGLHNAILGNPSVPVQVLLSTSSSVTAANLHILLALPNFSVGANELTLSNANPITVSGTELQQLAAFGSSGFGAGGNTITVNSAATLNAAGVAALANDAITLSGANTAITVSDTAANLSALVLPGWLTAPTLTLSQAGSITAAQLASLASLGVAHTITDPGYAVTLSDANVTLTPAQYAALDQGPNSIIANLAPSTYTVSAPLSNAATITDLHNVLSVSDANVPNATVKIYNEQGSLISATHEGQSSFTITASDPADAHGNGQFFVVTEVTNGVESAPLVVLDEGAIQAAVAAAGATFANAGGVTVAANEHLAVYTAGAVPQNLANPVLVYDPHAHTVSLDIPNSAPIVLVTLGTSTDPAALTAADFVVKHHG
jgi:hypothetical protein